MYVQRASYPNAEKKIIIFTGAGLSAESGISTFRDSDGLWENHKIDEVCNIHTWKNHFDLVHKFYNERRVQLKTVEPNEAHKTITRIKNKYKDDCIVMTQNVDDLLERAGIGDENVLHLHGELTKINCIACGHKWEVGYEEFNTETDRCPKCNSLKGVKPYIVFFNKSAPMYSQKNKAFEYLSNPDSILIVIGTMGNVIPISLVIGTPNMSGDFKKTVKAKTILNNLEANEFMPESLFDEIFYEKATVALPKIEQYLENNF